MVIFRSLLKPGTGTGTGTGTGARGLRGVLAAALMQTQFDLPDLAEDGATAVVVLVAADGKLAPEVVRGGTAAEAEAA